MRWPSIVCLLGFGCGSQSSSPTTDAPKHIDAPSTIDAPTIDAPPPTALTVDCATVTPVTTVTATTTVPYSYQFSSGSTIAVDDVVMFMMPSIHDVVPDATMSDTGLHVGFGETKCLRFTIAGEFHFHCLPHGFHGVITAN